MPDDFNIIELPLGFAGQLALAAMVTRPIQSTALARIYLGANYGIDDNPVDSYSQVATVQQFAFKGQVFENYPDNTNIIDDVLGLTVQLNGLDTVLPALNSFDALTNKLLVFAGNEIMSVIAAPMVVPGRYELSVIRGRYGTAIENHPADQPVYIVLRESITPLIHPHFIPGNTARFKVVFGDRNIADADAYDYAIAGSAFELPPPQAITINGTAFDRSPAPTDVLQVEFILPDAGAHLPHYAKAYSRIDFHVNNALKRSELVPWPATTLAVAWEDITDLPKQDFEVHAATHVDTGDHVIAGRNAGNIILSSFAGGTGIDSAGGTNVNVVGVGFRSTAEIWITGVGQDYSLGAQCAVVSITEDLIVVTLPDTTGVANVEDPFDNRDASGDDWFDVIYRDSVTGKTTRLHHAGQWNT